MVGWVKRYSFLGVVITAVVLMSASVAGAATAAPSRLARDHPAGRGPHAHASIIGGSSAEGGTFPWLAYIEDRRGDEVGVCTGTVVAPNLILTAGHCGENTTTEVENPATGYHVATGSLDPFSLEAHVSAVSEVIV
jgi:hypothetical protein